MTAEILGDMCLVRQFCGLLSVKRSVVMEDDLLYSILILIARVTNPPFLRKCVYIRPGRFPCS
jgi:hypothetical protein